MKSHLLTSLFAFLLSATCAVNNAKADSPKVGDVAPDFTLTTLDGKAITLSKETAQQPVVLVVLRGWPGYQCPLCTKQVHEFVAQAKAISGKARVLMVYPGPAENLKAHAEEFLHDKQWPKDFLFVTDPDYTFTKSYGLRWDTKSETAYPSTFIIDTKSKVRFAKISKSHGGRSSATEVIKTVDELK